MRACFATRLLDLCLIIPFLAWSGSIAAVAGPPRSNVPRFADFREAGPSTEFRPTGILERWWPDYPEALAMLAEILAGNQVTAENGWYKKGVSQTRFTWEKIRALYDSNQDTKITRSEFPGSDAEFKRLDVTHNGALTGFDLDLTARDPADAHRAEEFSVPAFAFADIDHDGKVTTRELDVFLFRAKIPAAFDSIVMSVEDELKARGKLAGEEGQGFVSLADFQAAFELAALRNKLPDRPELYVRRELVPREALLRSFMRREIGSWGSGPVLESEAPDFTLIDSDGKTQITLSKLVGEKPLILVFGNFTCGPFREHAGSLYVLGRRYRDRANFLIVYTREAHPADGWVLPDNQQAGVNHEQPRDYGSRAKLARICRRDLDIEMPMVVDTMNDAVTESYSGMPNRLYLIDRQGKIAYKGGRGPFGFKPEELEQSLILLLQPENSPGVKPVRHAHG